MNKITLLSFLIIAQFTLFGQVVQNLNLSSNSIITEAINTKLQYVFEDFKDGRILYKDNNISKAKLNYNFLADEIHYIDEKGNKMAIANTNDIQMVSIASLAFVPTMQGFYELIESGNISLFFKWNCKVTETGKPGALGIPNNTSKIYQYEKIPNGDQKLELPKSAAVYVEIVPYLKKGDSFIKATSLKGFTKAFKHKAEINQFIAKTPIDFKNEADLKKLTQYCNSLQ